MPGAANGSPEGSSRRWCRWWVEERRAGAWARISDDCRTEGEAFLILNRAVRRRAGLYRLCSCWQGIWQYTEYGTKEI